MDSVRKTDRFPLVIRTRHRNRNVPALAHGPSSFNKRTGFLFNSPGSQEEAGYNLFSNEKQIKPTFEYSKI
ncbi:hypothetical protein LEP1GSC193_2617 [Leptospira alstonii serovar Pingchang str. 80-412]|uniref:Uncharacterized protein n=2 Tax=Leptospira alstonii TaxID=28452 RepID=M6DIA3_9LEPT|nr:hypothetical protein LEP1GSC194_2657 [Leptospira alstonii serovar Sichuan str. 79601]EQA81124.1 hypothetical protein LEP1GSC193_2617 [Leptospira alstonii serovar Pingchang str. 80-412]